MTAAEEHLVILKVTRDPATDPDPRGWDWAALLEGAGWRDPKYVASEPVPTETSPEGDGEEPPASAPAGEPAQLADQIRDAADVVLSCETQVRDARDDLDGEVAAALTAVAGAYFDLTQITWIDLRGDAFVDEETLELPIVEALEDWQLEVTWRHDDAEGMAVLRPGDLTDEQRTLLWHIGREYGRVQGPHDQVPFVFSLDREGIETYAPPSSSSSTAGR